jgi:hypothetical protein
LAFAPLCGWGYAQALDAWIVKLHQEHIKFLTKTYKLGDARAVMIEGPNREALELVEIR